MAFTEEDVSKVLSGEGEVADKAKEILSMYTEDVNGLKANSVSLKTEKESIKAKYDELAKVNAKGAEDLKALQEQLAKNSPEEVKKAYEQRASELEKQYQGMISERDGHIKDYESQIASLQNDKRYLKCTQEFDSVAGKFNLDPSGRSYVMETILGENGSKFAERDLGDGKKALITQDGKSIEKALKDFLETPVGKRFTLNGNSGGGSNGSNGGQSGNATISRAEFENLSPAQQREVLKTKTIR